MPMPEYTCIGISTTCIMEKVSEIIDEIYENSTSYVRSQTKSAKLEIYERITNVISSGISAGIVITLLMLTLFFVNFGLAYWIGDLIESRSLGYVIVGGFYLIALILYLLLRNRMAPNIVKNAVLKKVSKTHDDFDELLEEQDRVHAAVDQNMHILKKNIGELKEIIVGSNKEKVDDSSRGAVNSAVDFVFKNVIFKNGGFITKNVLPMVANTILTSKLFKESKGKSFLENIKMKLMDRFHRKAG